MLLKTTDSFQKERGFVQTAVQSSRDLNVSEAVRFSNFPIHDKKCNTTSSQRHQFSPSLSSTSITLAYHKKNFFEKLKEHSKRGLRNK